MKNKIREKTSGSGNVLGLAGRARGGGLPRLRRPRRGEPLPEAPVECPERWSAPRDGGAPNPGAAFQDKGGWGEAGPGEGQERGL